MSGGRVRLLHSGGGLRQFACRYARRARTDEAVAKIPRLPSAALWETRQFQKTRFADRRFHDRRIAFGREALHNARNCPLSDKQRLAVNESESSLQQHSNRA